MRPGKQAQTKGEWLRRISPLHGICSHSPRTEFVLQKRGTRRRHTFGLAASPPAPRPPAARLPEIKRNALEHRREVLPAQGCPVLRVPEGQQYLPLQAAPPRPGSAHFRLRSFPGLEAPPPGRLLADPPQPGDAFPPNRGLSASSPPCARGRLNRALRTHTHGR